MTTPKLVISFALAATLAACSGNLHPPDQAKTAQTRLLGKWQARGSILWGYTDTQFEFFADGSVAESGKSRRGWQQLHTGTFKFVDATHVKIDLGLWDVGPPTIYEVDWQDNDHVTLRAGNEVVPLHRVK